MSEASIELPTLRPLYWSRTICSFPTIAIPRGTLAQFALIMVYFINTSDVMQLHSAVPVELAATSVAGFMYRYKHRCRLTFLVAEVTLWL